MFASNHEFVLCDNDTQRHVNKGAQQIAVHRLAFSPTLELLSVQRS